MDRVYLLLIQKFYSLQWVLIFLKYAGIRKSPYTHFKAHPFVFQLSLFTTDYEKYYFLFHLKLEMTFFCLYLFLTGFYEHKIQTPPLVLAFQYSCFNREIKCDPVLFPVCQDWFEWLLEFFWHENPFNLVHICCECTNT